MSDCISVPEHLKSIPVSEIGGIRNLRRLFRTVGITVLGELDGKPHSDFEMIPRCAGLTLWELRCLVREFHLGTFLEAAAWARHMRDWRPPERVIEVPRAITGLLRRLSSSPRESRRSRALRLSTLHTAAMPGSFRSKPGGPGCGRWTTSPPVLRVRAPSSRR